MLDFENNMGTPGDGWINAFDTIFNEMWILRNIENLAMINIRSVIFRV